MKFNVGDIVYQAFLPAKAGVIVKIEKPEPVRLLCNVRFQVVSSTTVALLSSPVCQRISGHDGNHYCKTEEGDISWPIAVHKDGRHCVSVDCDKLHTSTPTAAKYSDPMPTYTVRTAKGKEFTTKSVRSLTELIDSHAKALATHQQMYDRLTEERTKLGL